jgi:uncharacterized protein
MVKDDYERLKSLLAEMGGAVVAYSGGVDSTLVSRAAKDALGKKALCVLVESALMPRRDMEEAVSLAKELGLNFTRLEMDPLGTEDVAANSPERCYHCKKAIFQKLIDLAAERGLNVVLDGSNVDDDADYRPGHKALKELGVRSPLKELGIDKARVRSISKELALPTWQKPARACLASRVPYGTRLDEKTLRRIDAAEEVVRDAGFDHCRVRDHGDVARIEIMASGMRFIMTGTVRQKFMDGLKAVGYKYVTLDLAGYRTGSMNEALERSDSG